MFFVQHLGSHDEQIFLIETCEGNLLGIVSLLILLMISGEISTTKCFFDEFAVVNGSG